MYQYEHGGNARFKNRDILDFSANINPLGLQQGIKEAVFAAVSDCVNYPDYESRELRRKIGEYEAVDAADIFCGNGASDIIFRIVYGLKPKKALVLAPSFLDYSRALESYGCEVQYHMLYEKDNFGLGKDILERIQKEQFRLLFICNPNNPTGVLTDRNLLREIIRECNQVGTYIVVDECFMDFINESDSYTVKGLINEYDNLIILKAFTKIFALAGIRLGYAISSNRKLLEHLYFCGADWNVSTIAQAAGIAALHQPWEYIGNTRNFIQKEKCKIQKKLEEIKFKIFGSSAGYIFFKSPYSFDLAEKLYQDYKICIRSCGNYVGLDYSFYRIGIGKSSDNDRLIEGIQAVTKRKINL